MTQNTSQKNNHYQLIKKYLKKQYPSMSETENAILGNEVVFAPQKYSVEINNKPKEISEVRKSLADRIEKDRSESSFIPYSLDAQIADLIENTSCETSSINEYYRWISATAEIVKNTSDGDVTEQDIAERKEFITMSYERETEILLCLALYEAAGAKYNKEKIDLLKFKLARLREMRSIVKNTADKVKINKDKLHLYCKYCNELLGQNINNNLQNVNSKLNEIIEDSSQEEFAEDYSFFDSLKRAILYMVRQTKKASVTQKRTKAPAEKSKKSRSLSPSRTGLTR